MKLAEDILNETDGKICKHWLGRKLSKTIEGRKVLNNISFTVLKGDKIQCSSKPLKEGYIFIGWYLDGDFCAVDLAPYARVLI